MLLSHRSTPLLLSSLALLGGCQHGPVSAQLEAPLPDKFLVVDWQDTERTALESAFQRGVVVVRYDGHRVSVLSNCRAPGRYSYGPGLGPSPDDYSLQDAHQVGAHLPFYVATLGGQYKSNQTLHVRTVTVGEWTSPLHVTRFDMPDECAAATHVVSAISVGAFELESTDAASAQGELGWRDIGANGSSSTSRNILRSGGDHQKCVPAADAGAPPKDCDRPVRVELSAITDPTLVATGEKLAGSWTGRGHTVVEGGETIEWTMKLTITDPPVIGTCAEASYERTSPPGAAACHTYWTCEKVDPTQTMLRAGEKLKEPSDWCNDSTAVMTVRGVGAAGITYRGDYSDWADVQKVR